jgi:aerobic-type carbon monoxide dehydrogenase small subunit (CoxS/CutS family)
MDSKQISLSINGEITKISVKPNETLSDVLREKLGLVGTRIACDEGTCGSCTVLVEREPVYSCMELAINCDGKTVKTIEGMATKSGLHPVQRAFLDAASSQCGFCTAGFIMSAEGLLEKNPDPSLEEVKVALSGNICRCTDYTRYVNAVLDAAKLKGGKSIHE